MTRISVAAYARAVHTKARGISSFALLFERRNQGQSTEIRCPRLPHRSQGGSSLMLFPLEFSHRQVRFRDASLRGG